MASRVIRAASCLALLSATLPTPARAAQEKCDGKVATIVGTNKKDELFGTSGADVIVGLGGNDFIRGGYGDDTICGGADNDDILGDDGNDTLGGGDGRDYVDGGDGNDTIDGGPQSDKPRDIDDMSDSSAMLRGGPGDDVLFGDSGADAIYGGDGKDTLEGGNGNDTLHGADRGGVTDDVESDWVTYENETSGVTLTLSGNTLVASAEIGSSRDVLIAIENARLSDYPDVAHAVIAKSKVILGKGDDRITRTRSDIQDESVFKGGPGTDTFDFREEKVAMRLDLAAGTFATVVDPAGSDTIEGFENAIGSAHFDVLVGDGKANRLEGGDGEDLIEAGGGNDVVLGDAGNDSLYGDADDDKLYGKDGPHNGLDEETTTNLTDGGPGTDECFETGTEENCEDDEGSTCEVFRESFRAAQAADSCTKIVWSQRSAGYDLFMISPDGTGKTQLTRTAAKEERQPVLSPEGGRIAFVSYGGDANNFELFVMDSDGTDRTRLTTTAANESDPEWSPDGTQLAYLKGPGPGGQGQAGEIWVIDADGKNAHQVATNAWSPVWLGDGVAYLKFPAGGGSHEIFSVGSDGSNESQITQGAGGSWGELDLSPDGSTFIYVDAYGYGFLATIGVDGDFDPERGAALPQDYAGDGDTKRFDLPKWSPDGSRVATFGTIDGVRGLYLVSRGGAATTVFLDADHNDIDPDWGYFNPPSP